MQIEDANSSITTHVYNCDHRKVESDDGVDVTRLVYDGNNVLTETDDLGTTEAVYTVQPRPYAHVVSQHRDAASSFFHFDGIHNTSELTDDTETVTDDYRFTAWGKLLRSTGGTDNGQQYKGQFSAYRKDADAVQTERRPYQPDQARFPSEDPAEAKLNAYLYCSNNPVNEADPSGLQGVHTSNEQSEIWQIPWTGYGVEVTRYDYEIRHRSGGVERGTGGVGFGLIKIEPPTVDEPLTPVARRVTFEGKQTAVDLWVDNPTLFGMELASGSGEPVRLQLPEGLQELFASSSGLTRPELPLSELERALYPPGYVRGADRVITIPAGAIVAGDKPTEIGAHVGVGAAALTALPVAVTESGIFAVGATGLLLYGTYHGGRLTWQSVPVLFDESATPRERQLAIQGSLEGVAGLSSAAFLRGRLASAPDDLARAGGEMRALIPSARAVRGGSVTSGMATARSPVWSSAAGDVVVDAANLPGSAGVQIARRLTTAEMEALTQTHKVEFSLVYRTGSGTNGGGGTYWLHSGTINSVDVPISSNVRWIYHTHPGGTPYASGIPGDQNVLQLLQQAGSPQQSSVIVPVGRTPFRFNVNQKRLP